MGQKYSIFSFVGGESGYPIGVSGRIGSSNRNTWKLFSQCRLVLPILAQPVCITVLGFAMLLESEQIRLVADLDGK